MDKARPLSKSLSAALKRVAIQVCFSLGTLGATTVPVAMTFVACSSFAREKTAGPLDIGSLVLEEQCECLGISGPLIRLVPGNKYRLTLRNAATEVTNLHTHGLHIVGDGDADDVTRTVSGGGFCLDYTWNIRSDHPGGTYWYHAHHHGLSEKQVGGGAFGMLIVEDNTNLDPVLPSWAENEHLLQVVSTPDGLIGNGRKDDIIAIDASQWYRLRVSFVSVAAVPLNFTFDDEGNCDVHKVATDGVWRSAVPGPTGSVFELTGASRADFAIRCNTPQMLVPLYYGDELASTIVVGSVEPSPHVMEDWIPNRPYSLQDLSTLAVPDGNTFSVNLGYDHVNDIVWDPDVPIGTIGFDEVHEWTIAGNRHSSISYPSLPHADCDVGRVWLVRRRRVLRHDFLPGGLCCSIQNSGLWPALCASLPRASS